MIYLDHCATTEILPQVRENINFVLDYYGNPSSTHKMGTLVYQQMENLKILIKKKLQVKDGEIYFTSGATESNNLIIQSHNPKRGNWACFQSSHASITLTVKKIGGIVWKDPKDFNYINFLKKHQDDFSHISLLSINNEIGMRLHLKYLIEELKKMKKQIHLDISQSFLKESENLQLSSISYFKYCDFISFSAHKCGGLKGLGFIWERQKKLKALFWGGSQQGNIRPGTENTLACLTFPSVIHYWELIQKSWLEHITKLKAFLFAELDKHCLVYKSIEDELIKNNSSNQSFQKYFFSTETDSRISPFDFSPSIINLSFKNCKSEVLVRCLSDKEIYISNSSACHSKKKDNPILSSFNVSQEYQRGAIRIAPSIKNTELEIKELVQKTKQIIKKYF